VALDPARLKVEQVQGQWVVRDPQRVLFNFGDRPDEARQALEVVRRHGFRQVGVVGQAAPLVVFLAQPAGPAGPLPATPAPGGGSRQFGSLHSSRSKVPPVVKQAEPGTPDLSGIVTGTVPTLPPPAAPAAFDARPGHRSSTSWRSQPHFGPRPPASPLTP